VEEAEGLA
jgi:hypothetical protein